MNWKELLTSKRFIVAAITLIAVIVVHLTGIELPVDDLVALILALLGGGLAGYVTKEKRTGGVVD